MIYLFILAMAKTRCTPVIIKQIIILRQIRNLLALFVLFKNLWLSLIIIKDHSIFDYPPIIVFANFVNNSLPSRILVLCNIFDQNITI